MKTLKWLNEKGNVSVKVRDGVRAQINAKLSAILSENFEDVVPNANGGFSIPVATDSGSGKPIYATVNFTLNMADPAEKVARKSAPKKEQPEEEIPSLF